VTDLFGATPNNTSQSDRDVQHAESEEDSAEHADRDVRLLDTTLRDGEQAPGVTLSPEEKAEIATALDRAGVAVIEAGSACTGDSERETIERVADLELDARVTSFARGVQADVDLALDCGVDGVHLVVPASDRHIEEKVGSSREAVVEKTSELVAYARDYGLWVEVIGEDGSRADLDFLERLARAAHDAGANRFCYADTVGHAGPERTTAAVSRLADLGPTSTHTHDDLGLAVTNALASVAAGADLVHATVNGVGERAGNLALEEAAIALDHVYDVETVETTELYGLARVVADATDVPLAPNKAVVGENAFAHESGIHTDGTLKDEEMYEPYPPEKVGRERRLVLGKHTGRAGAAAALAEHGVEVTDDELGAVVARVQDRERDRRIGLRELTATSGGSIPTASVELEVDGDQRVASGTGDGPVDAAVSAVREAVSGSGDSAAAAADATLESYHVDAITGGTDAVVTVEVEMRRGDHAVTAAASDDDITRASVTAMVDALDRLLVVDGKTDTATADD
jgi:D-citramalate synthase